MIGRDSDRFPGRAPVISGAAGLEPATSAERNVLAHLLKMEVEGKVARDGENWRTA